MKTVRYPMKIQDFKNADFSRENAWVTLQNDNKALPIDGKNPKYNFGNFFILDFPAKND